MPFVISCEWDIVYSSSEFVQNQDSMAVLIAPEPP